MKSITVLVALSLILFSSFIFAQDKNDEEVNRSSNSLNFYIINGYAVSYKFKSNSDKFYRVNLDLSSHYSNGKIDNTYGPNGAESQIADTKRDGENKESSFSISLAPQYCLNIYKTGFAKLYAGAGPFLNYYYYKSVIDYNTHNPISQNSDDKTKSNFRDDAYSFGITSFVGIEGYATKNISLFAEMQLAGAREWRDTRSEYSTYDTQGRIVSGSKNDEDTKSWFYNLSNIRMGVSLYF